MRNGLMVVAVMVAGVICPRAALAWNECGHMVVGLIAYRQLNDDQRQKIAVLLRAHPHYQHYLTAKRPDGVSEEEWAFLRAGPWPDYVRPARPGPDGEIYKGPEITRFHRGVWHYIDMPWVPPADRKLIDPTTLPARPPATAPTTRNYNPEGPENILEALEYNAKVLANTEAAPADRAVALSWMNHLLGDLHQPLHACSVYSSAFPAGDRGGNEPAIRANGNVMRLHAFWDECLGNSDAYVAVDFLANLITTDPMLTRERLAELPSEGSYKGWANESHEYAIALAHLNGRLKSARYLAFDQKELMIEDVPSLPASYDANARDLSKRRVAQAGYRLAAKLGVLLGK